ncbi:MAG: hypothetical protein EON85_16470, partial [Brevundimonas sp.]
IGIPNHGVLRVGDSLSESGLIRFAGLPNFAPEILQRVRVKDPLKAKHLKKALDGLAEEGVTQLFRPEIGSDFIVGAVGQLQFEVMADRLGEEYGLEVIFEPSPYAEARWAGQVELGNRLRHGTLPQGGVHEDEGTRLVIFRQDVTRGVQLVWTV